MSVGRSRGGSLRGRPSRVVQAGVVACVALAATVGALMLGAAIDRFDARADSASSATYADRMLLTERQLGSRKVVEDARLWMPSNARYLVLVGDRVPRDWQFSRYFLLGYLFPRRQVEARPADWLFCYRCDRSVLGRRFVVLSSAPNGVEFGRLRK